MARAYDRYCVVIDRWRAGGYPRKPRRPAGELLKAQAELMTALSDIESRSEDLEQRIGHLLEKGPLYRTIERWWQS